MAKSWTYNQVTAAAQEQIESCMGLAARYPDNTEGDRFMQRQHAAHAFGAWCLWNSVTMGCQRDGDGDRLESMTRLPK